MLACQDGWPHWHGPADWFFLLENIDLGDVHEPQGLASGLVGQPNFVGLVPGTVRIREVMIRDGEGTEHLLTAGVDGFGLFCFV